MTRGPRRASTSPEAYCHVPHGSQADFSGDIEGTVERYAPGFRKLVIARAKKSAADLEQYNPNYVGGDINAGVSDLLGAILPAGRDGWTRTLDPGPEHLSLFVVDSAWRRSTRHVRVLTAARSVLKRVFER